MNQWEWMDFSYKSGKSGMDSYRAAFQVYEFITMFNIEQFAVIQQDGEAQNARIEIVYRPPRGVATDDLESLWSHHLKTWSETH